MKGSLARFSILSAVLAMQPSWSMAAPSTATFMNVLTVCGAGSSISLSADLQGSITGLYEQQVTRGRAVQEILPQIAKMLPQNDTYRQYLDCITKLLAN